MENVEVLVEDFADGETLASLGLRSPWDLLGLYVGVPMTERSFFSAGYLPERIYLYRRPILHAAGHPENIVETIREVVIHEIGHHFGFDDDELEEMVRRTD
jgi:predicted Zn-dependent protease with MMP-like domain